MQKTIRTDSGTVPVRTVEMSAGNPNLAAQVRQSGGAAAVDGTERKMLSTGPSNTAATTQEQRVAEPLQEIPYAEKNPEYYDLTAELPSQFIFYSFNTLSIRPLKLQEAKKIFQAQSLKSMRLMVEAVSSCLQPGLSAFDLTRGDFYFLLYWLRIQSFKKSPYIVSFTCADYGHLERVINKDLPRETLFNDVTVHNVGELTTIRTDLQKIDAQIEIIRNEYEVNVYPIRMRDVVEIDELVQRDENGQVLVGADKNPLPPTEEQKWEAEYASLISPFRHGATLAERIAFFNSLDCGPDLLGDLDYFAEITNHGVQEQASLTCKECGAKMDVDVSINALSFFPAVQRA